MLSLIYPGNFSLEAMIPAVLATEKFLYITPDQRPPIIWRTDGGFGSDANLQWLIERDYHVVAKGFAWKRARAWAGRVSNWTEVRPGQRWIAWAPDQLDLRRPTRIVAVRWLTPKGQIVMPCISQPCSTCLCWTSPKSTMPAEEQKTRSAAIRLA